MADKKPEHDVKEIAGGWMTERVGTDAPTFLKFATPVIAACAIIYAVVFMNGEVTHTTRGKLVQQFNAATQSSNAFMYFVAALIAIYLIIVTMYAWSKPHED